MIEKLDKSITRKGLNYTQISETEKGYLYRAELDGVYISYEVFLKKNSPRCVDFGNRVYSDSEFVERFPSDNDFGKWAWSYNNIELANEKLLTLWPKADASHGK